MSKPSISVADIPYSSARDKDNKPLHRSAAGKNTPDKLGTGDYATSLAHFAMKCETPLTIGIQGEWGSGKTSLLNMMREDIEDAEVESGSRAANYKGIDAYRIIWINTWEHSLLKTPEGCLISIIEEIIDSISSSDGQFHTAQRAKSALTALAKGAVKAGAGLTLGMKGAEAVDDLMASSGSNVVKDLRNALHDIVDTVVNREKNPVERFIIFIDDLDRLEPPVAVQVLELLKNIFNVDHCVFVLAIDYQVVVKGLEHKFGKPNSDNEWEFRAFFDKIIQLPFMMPMGKYDLSNYINSLLVENIGYIAKGDKNAIADGVLAKVVKLSLGHNPRSMKRLLNSLSLIKLQNSAAFDKDPDASLRRLVFALVCFQISFPKVYELMLINPDFTQWDDEFVNRVTGGPHEENRELNAALNKAMQVHEEQFDEEWEQALFKIVWVKNWQRSRLAETSQLLSLIRDRILSDVTDDTKLASFLGDGLKMTAVTAVSSTEDTVLSAQTNDDGEAIAARLDYWRRFSKRMEGSGTIFDTKVQRIKSTFSSGRLIRKNTDRLDLVQFAVSTSSSAPLKIEGCGGPAQETLRFFSLMKERKGILEEAVGASIKFKIDPEASRQLVSVSCPEGIPGYKSLDNKQNSKYRDAMFDWFAVAFPKLEQALIDCMEADDAAGSYKGDPVAQ